jgi:hypothetical protein
MDIINLINIKLMKFKLKIKEVLKNNFILLRN